MLSFNRLALFTLAGCALLAPAADAAQPYNDGDIFLAFRAAANPNSSYLYNLGPALGFYNTTTQQPLSLNIAQDLSTTFGPGWATRADLTWSVVGVVKTVTDDFEANTIFLSAPHLFGNIGSLGSTPWDRPSAFGAGDPALRIQAMGNRYKLGSDGTGSTESTINAFGLIQPNGETNSYRSYAPGGPNTTGAAYFNSFVNNGIEGGLISSGGAVLDLYTIRPRTGGGPSEFQGNFRLDSSANVTFNPEGVIPEPASAAVLAAGALVLGFRRRRANV